MPHTYKTINNEINSSESSTTDILIRLCKQDSILNNRCKLVNKTSIIYTDTIPLTPLQCPISHRLNPPKQHLLPPTNSLNMSYYSAVRQSPYMPITKFNNIPVINTTPTNSLELDHLSEDESNTNFVYKILSYLNMSTSSLISYNFINSIYVIYFNSPNSSYRIYLILHLFLIYTI